MTTNDMLFGYRRQLFAEVARTSKGGSASPDGMGRYSWECGPSPAGTVRSAAGTSRGGSRSPLRSVSPRILTKLERPPWRPWGLLLLAQSERERSTFCFSSGARVSQTAYTVAGASTRRVEGVTG